MSYERVPFGRALLWIGFSTLVPLGVWWGYSIRYQHFASDPSYTITAISQRGPLESHYLAELLELSVDRPANLYLFNVKEAQEKILGSPVIKSASISKLYPSALHVDYQVRKPIAYLENIKNGAIDKQGVVFPMAPFFTPKHLPKLILADFPSKWGEKVEVPQEFHFLQQHLLVEKVDFSRPNEVIAFLQDQWVLRLSLDNLEKGVDNYLLLRENLDQNKSVVDLRIPKLAFLRRSDD